MTIDLHPSPSTFPVVEMIDTGIWADISTTGLAVLAVLWNFYRQYPDSCHPSRATIARLAGVSPPSVTSAIKTLEGIGIVEVIPSPGPRANTYRVHWKGLRLQSPRSKTNSTESPYPRPAQKRDLTLAQDGHGRNLPVYSRKSIQTYKMADGCILRSAREMAVHDLLVGWKIPHWSDVTYHHLGIRLIHPKTKKLDLLSTVDFLLGPRLLLEVVGLPSTQSAAKKYHQKLARKLTAAKKAGWEIITLEAGDLPDVRIMQPILDSWSTSTIEDAEHLLQRLEVAGKWSLNRFPCVLLQAHIACAKKRKSGKKEPMEPRGLFEKQPQSHGPPAMVRVAPRIVLDRSLGRSQNPLSFDFVERPTPRQVIGDEPPEMTAEEGERLTSLRDQIEELQERLWDLDEDSDEYHTIQTQLVDAEAEASEIEGRYRW